MDADATRADAPDGDAAPAADRAVFAYETRPGRTLLVETDNEDAWIASDLAVEPPR